MAAPTRSSCFSHRSDLQPLLNLQFSTWSTCHRWILEKTFAKWQQIRCLATILLDSNSNSCNALLLSMTPLDRLGAVGIQVSIKRALNYAVGEPEGSLALSSRPVDLGVFGPFLQWPFLGQSAAALPECLLYLVVCFTWLYRQLLLDVCYWGNGECCGMPWRSRSPSTSSLHNTPREDGKTFASLKKTM